MPAEDPFINTLHKWTEIMMHRSMENFLYYAREKGLSMSQFGVLVHLNRRQSCGVTDLGDHLGVTSAAASQLLDRLVQQELILRTEDPHDRRVKQIILTEKGRHVLEEAMHARQKWLNDLAEVFSQAEKEQITESLCLMIEKASQTSQIKSPEL
jgi:DNA-binding MarR family transcriptional regulator